MNPHDLTPDPAAATLHKLLGRLEREIMELMWERREATVRDIVLALRPTHPLAYTTIMTVMFHLAEKGLLTRRQLNHKTYVYTTVQSREEYLSAVAGRLIDGLVADFGDRALNLMRRHLAQDVAGDPAAAGAASPAAERAPAWES
jgi:predicted transcriptional regulator